MKAPFKELNVFIKESLSDAYSQYSFKPEPDYNAFSRSESEVKLKAVIGPTAEYSSYIVYRPFFMVENKLLEETKETLLKPLKGERVTGNAVLNRHQGDFLASQFGINDYKDWSDYTIENKDNAVAMVNHHTGFMNKVGWKFFEVTSTLEGISKFLNERVLNAPVQTMSESAKVQFIKDNGPTWINGLVASWLIKDKELNKLFSNYRAIYFPDHAQKTLNVLAEGMRI